MVKYTQTHKFFSRMNMLDDSLLLKKIAHKMKYGFGRTGIHENST